MHNNITRFNGNESQAHLLDRKSVTNGIIILIYKYKIFLTSLCISFLKLQILYMKRRNRSLLPLIED